MVHLGQRVCVRTRDSRGMRAEYGIVVAIGVHDKVPDRERVEKGGDPRAVVVELISGHEVAIAWDDIERVITPADEEGLDGN